MLKRIASSRLLRLFSSAVIDQAMLSATSLAIGLVLIRYTSDVDFGHYVLAQSALLLLVSIQGAFINGPLSVLAPKKPAEEKLEMVNAMYGLQKRLSRWAGVIALMAAGVVWAINPHNPALVWVCFAFAVTAWLGMNREFVRQMLLIYTRPQQVLLADAAYVATLLVLMGFAILCGGPYVAPMAVLALGLAAAVGALPGVASMRKDPGLFEADARKFLPETLRIAAWATGGAVIYWSYTQGFNYVLAARLDVAAVATVAGVRYLIQPLNFLTAGIKQLLLPTASGWYRDYGLNTTLKRLLLIVVFAVLLAGTYCGVLWGLRDWLTETVIKKTYPDRDHLLLLWMLIASIVLVRDLLITPLYVREQFRSLTALAFTCACISLSLGWVLMSHYGATGGLMGFAAGEVCNLLGVGLLLFRETRRDRQS